MWKATPTDRAADRAPVSRVPSWLARPIDGAWLAAFRVLYGLVLCASMLRFLAYGWVERFFVRPTFFFKYWGFEWVEPLPAELMRPLFAALALLALAVALGVAFRLSAFAFALGLSYVQLIDVSTYLNHYYLAALLAWLLAASPAQRTWSFDAWLVRRWARRRAQPVETPPSISAGWLYLFRFQIAIVYTFAGLAKAQSDWLVHAQPLRIWLGAQTDLPLIGALFTVDGVPLVLSWCGFLFDTTIVLWLSWRKTRPVAYAALIVFHVFTRLLFPIGMFPVIMVLAALVFFEPSWPRPWLARFGSRWAPLRRAALDTPPAPGAAERSPLERWHAFGWLLAALYCVMQLALPLRFLAYDGNVLWHEQGMRFSWRVMLRAKGGTTTFVVKQPESGKTWFVSPSAYLSGMQESEMVSQPDLIWQLAQHIRADFARRGLGPVEVRAQSRVSLNGRRSEPFIDPEVDLVTQQDGLDVARLVLPAPSTTPPHTQPVL
jgi:vitamin K-dependent gamma-carboxylase